MNEVVKNKSQMMAAALSAAQSFAKSGGGDYLQISGKTGIITYGKENTELPAGAELAVNMKTFSQGWIYWRDEKVLQELMAKPFEGEIALQESQLPDVGPPSDTDERWNRQASVEMKILDGGHDVTFKVSSWGGVSAMQKLFAEYVKDMTQKGDDAVIIVSIDSEGRLAKEKKYGKIYAPVFTIVEWTTEAKLAEAFPEGGGADDASAYVAPVTKAIEAPKKEEAPAPVSTAAKAATADAPGGRRRRF
jgi:hypothetical protein